MEQSALEKRHPHLTQDQITHLKHLETQLQDLVRQKKHLDRSIYEIERNIYSYETNYLSDTSLAGNVVKGFEGFVQTRGSERQRQQHIYSSDENRIFSHSSTTFTKALNLDDAVVLVNKPSVEKREGGVVVNGVGSTVEHEHTSSTPFYQIANTFLQKES
jgi:chromatin modification-related protein EAF6